MSVINKMLRDLDQRQAKAAASPVAPDGLRAGTAVPADFPRAASAAVRSPGPARRLGLALACAVLALVLGASWWASQALVPSGPASVPPPAPASTPAVAAAPSVPVRVPASVPVLAPSPAVAAPESVVQATPVAVPPVLVKRDPAALGLRMDTALTPRKPAERAVAPDRAPIQTSELPKGPTPNEALERAQALWNTGSRDAAIDLLQDAVAVAERAGAGGSFAQGNPVLLPLVRELTRMQLAESRYGAVWEGLTRLEAQLGSAPDLWAIRGNAAQRLGRHQDSVHVYMMALQVRPNEQRWLLGAAVSLAALGQTSSAAEMADKARTVGVVSPEVLAYLRQMGVPLRDK